MVATFELLFTKLKPTTYQPEHVSLFVKSIKAEQQGHEKCSNNLRQKPQV